MKVSELIEQLKQVPGDLDVYLATDAEGNGYSRIDSVEQTATHEYERDEWSGNFICYYHEPWDEMENPPEEVIMIWPV